MRRSRRFSGYSSRPRRPLSKIEGVSASVFARHCLSAEGERPAAGGGAVVAVVWPAEYPGLLPAAGRRSQVFPESHPSFCGGARKSV